MNVFLVSRHMDPVGEERTLKADTTTIGRDKSNDISLPDAGISRYRSPIVCTGGLRSVEDLSRVNGTWLNDVHVERKASLNGISPRERLFEVLWQ